MVKVNFIDFELDKEYYYCFVVKVIFGDIVFFFGCIKIFVVSGDKLV